MDLITTYYVVAGALIVVGLLGTVLPVLPGLPVMFAGMWLAAWVDGYERVGAGTLAVLGVLVLLSIVVDFTASFLGARRVGASTKGQIGAGLGGVVGLFFGLPGLVAGPFLGAALGEHERVGAEVALQVQHAQACPAVGRDARQPDFFWLAGQGGYGFQTCPAASQLAADLIGGRATGLTDSLVHALDPARFG